MDRTADRRERLRRSLMAAGAEMLAVGNPINVTYLTGFTGDSTWLLLSKDRAILVSDGRYQVQIAEECPNLETSIRPPDRTILEAVASAIVQSGARNVGVEATHMTLADAEKLRDLAKSVAFQPTIGLVEDLRRIKDDTEIAEIRDAIWIAEKAFAMFCALLKGSDTEKSLADAMDGYLRRAGGTGSSFPPIVAVGDRSALPHAPPIDRRVDESSFLLLDWGAAGRMYNSDLTRIILTDSLLRNSGSGRRPVESDLRKRYTVVLRAQQIAIDLLRPGVKASDVDRAVRAFLEREGVNSNFNHGLGHGIGLQVHEGPYLRSNSNDVLAAGMVVTVEPGIYFAGWGGIRIEDDVLITPEGCEVMTSLPKDVASVFGD